MPKITSLRRENLGISRRIKWTKQMGTGLSKLNKSVLSREHRLDPGGAPVPEPATMLVSGSGLIGLAVFSRRKFKK